jgi:hypothetical protein
LIICADIKKKYLKKNHFDAFLSEKHLKKNTPHHNTKHAPKQAQPQLCMERFFLVDVGVLVCIVIFIDALTIKFAD